MTMRFRMPTLAVLITMCLAPVHGVAQSRAGSGAAVGATVGAVGFGSFVGLIAAGLCDMAVCDGEFAHGFMIGATVGAAGGALLGAGVGALLPAATPDGSAGDDPSDSRGLRDGAPGSWAWHLEYGRPTGRGAGPPPGSAVRLGLGYRVRPALVVGAEVARIGFVETQRAFDPTDPVGPFADEDARSLSLLLGATHALDPEEHVRLRLAAGMARTDMTRTVTVPVPVWRQETIERTGWGVHVGGGLEAGWPVAGGLRMGFEGRFDWISDTPMGDVPFYTLSLALWG